MIMQAGNWNGRKVKIDKARNAFYNLNSNNYELQKINMRNYIILRRRSYSYEAEK